MDKNIQFDDQLISMDRIGPSLKPYVDSNYQSIGTLRDLYNKLEENKKLTDEDIQAFRNVLGEKYPVQLINKLAVGEELTSEEKEELYKLISDRVNVYRSNNLDLDFESRNHPVR